MSLTSQARNSRLAVIGQRLATLSGLINRDVVTLGMVMSEAARAQMEHLHACDCRARDSLIAERTRLHQDPPNGLDTRATEIRAEIAAIERTLSRSDIGVWIRDKSAQMLSAYRIELNDVMSAMADSNERAAA